MITTKDILSRYTPIQVRHWIEFFHMGDGKSAIKMDNLVYYSDLLWAVYSPFKDIFYLHNTRPRWDGESASKSLKKYYTDGNLYKLLSPDQEESLKLEMRRVYKHYVKHEGTFRYRDYYTLIAMTIERDDYMQNHKLENNFLTKLSVYNKKIEEILTKYK